MTPDPRTASPATEPHDEAAELFRPRMTGAPAAVPCPPPDLVQASRAGTLPPELQTRVAAHVETCVVCQTLGEALDDASLGLLAPEEQERILQRVRTELDGSQRQVGRRGWWAWSTAAAGIALAAVALTLIWQSRRAATEPGAGQLVRDSRPPATQSMLRLEKPDLRRLAANAPAAAGSMGSAEGLDLSRALEPYRTDDFAEVARMMSVLITRYPQSASGYLHLGVSNLFLRHDADAVMSLEAAERLAKGDPELRLEASWYLALAYHRTGQLEQAQVRLETLCRGGSLRSARACAGLQQLATPVHVLGVVTGPGGVPLAGATVGEYTAGRFEGDYGVGVITRFSAITDGTGRYSVSGQPTRRLPQLGLRAVKSGYFSAFKVVPVSADMRVDFVLDPWVHISLGEIVRGTIKSGDRDRQVALTVPTSGTLEVSLATPNRADFDLYVETPNGDVYGPRMSAPLRVAMPVVGSSTYQIWVLALSESPRFFELTTRLR